MLIISTDTGEVTVSPFKLIFTNSNWNTPQTFTITGVDDDVDDGDQTTEIKVIGALPPTSNWRVPYESLLVKTIDDDG